LFSIAFPPFFSLPPYHIFPPAIVCR
jgi:hypothetical protein